MNYHYLHILDDDEKMEGENPSVGIILCKDADKTFVEYVLHDYNRPMGVATYKFNQERLKDLVGTYKTKALQVSARLGKWQRLFVRNLDLLPDADAGGVVVELDELLDIDAVPVCNVVERVALLDGVVDEFACRSAWCACNGVLNRLHHGDSDC